MPSPNAMVTPRVRVPMGDLAEDRVYDDRAETQLVFAASSRGVAAVETAGDSIGRFRLAHECDARDLAGAGGRLAVATPTDVLVCEVDDDVVGDWVETGFGPAVAVGFDEGDLLAAGPDGALGRVLDPGEDPTDWLGVADVDGAVRALDGPLVGASDGVYRFTVDGIVDVGLDDARDVAAAGVPLAATDDGLFRLGNGWLRELDGAVDVVAGTDHPAAGAEPAGDGLARGHAAAGDQLYEFHGGGGDPDQPAHDEVVDPAVAARAWRERATPAGRIVDVAYGNRTYVLAGDSSVLLDRGDEWSTRVLGLPDPTALATPD
jgi:hypothetical protein